MKNLLGLTVCSLILLIVYRFPAKAGYQRYAMEIIFRVGISVILIGVVWQANRSVAAFLGLALFSQFYPVFGSESARGFYNVMCGVVLYTVIVKYGKNWTTHLMDMMCIVAICNIIPTIWQACGLHFLWRGSAAVTGLMENPNSLSALLALCFPAFLRGRWIWLSPLIVLGLFMAGSSGGLIAVMFGLCFFFTIILQNKKYLYPFGMGIIILIAFYLIFFDTYQSFHVRWEAWGRAIEIIKDNWLVGCGIGRWKTEFIVLVLAKQFPEGFIRLHSTILQSILEMGIGFIIILAWYLFDITKRSWRNFIPLVVPLSALIIILANGSVNFLIRIAPNAALVIVWFAILELELRNVRWNNRNASG